MGYPAGHKEKTRNRIIAAARKLWKTQGYSGASVDRVMEEAGLTRGGFYAHFKSKDDLFAHALNENITLVHLDKLKEEGVDDFKEQRRQVIQNYLSPLYRDHPDQGCPLTSLAQEGARFQGAPQQAMSSVIEELVTWLSGGEKSNKGLAGLSMMVGALTLSRATHNTELSDKILQSVERELGQLFNDDPNKDILRRRSMEILKQTL
ncbi:TetR/AcrR family transcriptional regulator [Terasakiella sp. SH-1]|uniref:TetR/AcrR family transcriptional regulator n=1 Tax=Terasakiella sp. SH-1 TaxID=2560057 RepID=UPI0010731866|nr:TetR/AcrR family transcriptional regulator [Terasakiella sp. SH-1]